MSSKKRSAYSVQEVEGQLDVEDEEPKSSKKKKRSEKGKKAEIDVNTSSIKPMERTKKRKALDKERRHVTVDNQSAQKKSDETKPLMVDVNTSSIKPMERTKKRKALDKERRHATVDNQSAQKKSDETKPLMVSLSCSGLPEFHISVFKDLAAADVSVREAAVETLVMELQEVQKAYDKLENKDVEEGGLKLEAEKDDGLDNCAPSVKYAVRRLVRGVSSSRECARQGFALGLTVLVGTIPNIKVGSLMKLIADLLDVSSSMKGQEVKDCLLGRLFAYGSLSRSGRLTQEYCSNKNTSYIKEFTTILISLASKKRYLQEPAVTIILDLIEKLPVEALLNDVLEAPGIQEWFDGAIEVGNPDALLLALKLRERISLDNASFAKLLPNPYSTEKLFAADCLSSLSNCFKESTFCQPRIHSLWSVILNILLPDVILQSEESLSVSSLKKHKKSRKSGSSEEEISKNFQNFLEVVIEGSLLSSSHDRKHLAFDVLLTLLPRLPASFISTMLSYKVVQCIMDILSTKDSWLHKAVQFFIKELSNWVMHDDMRRISVIVALQKHSYGKFDCITRTKTVKSLMSEFKSESGCLLFIQNLANLFVDESYISEEPSDQSQTTDDNSEVGSVEEKDSGGTLGNSDFLRTWVVESLPSVLKNSSLEADAKFRVQKEILKFLAVQGLFTASLGSEVTSFELQEKFRWPKAATSSSLSIMSIEQLQLLLANAQKAEGSRDLAKSSETNDLGAYCMRFLSTMRNIPSVSLFRRLNDEDENALKKLQEMETELWREEKNCGLSAEADKLHALRCLLIQLFLQILLRPDDFSEAASELIMCCKKAFKASDLLGSTGEDEQEDDETPELMDVLVDTLLSLLPQSSAPMRTAIEQVFKYFCEQITDDNLLRMLRVIKKNLKPARHQNAESSDNDEEDDEDFLHVEEDDEMDEAEIGETGESDEQTDESEAVVRVDEVDKEHFDNSDDSDGGMDDDAMFRMDTYLAQIFKERKNQTGSESAQSQLMLFKLRVLSLLEIYLHKNPGNPQVLLVYSNLVRAFISSHSAEGSEQLGQRLWGILQKKVLKAKDYPQGEAVQLVTLESLLEKSLKLASKPFRRKKSITNLSKKQQSASWNRHKMVISLGQNSTFWILKIVDAKNLSETELQRVFDIFEGVFVDYFNSKKSQIKFEFLKEIVKRRPWIGHHLLGFLLDKCGIANSEFRRVEALDLVIEILTSLISSDISSDDSQKSAKAHFRRLRKFKSVTPMSSEIISSDSSQNLVKMHLSKICELIKESLTNMPEKQSRRAGVRKFCVWVFNIVASLNLTKLFLDSLPAEGHAACETQLGEQFNSLTKQAE